ncbi:MAG: YdeI/OmpD-associated family protein [Ferruginibacter sp.]
MSKEIRFATVLKKFGALGEKTGWTYIDIPQKLAEELKPGNKKSFRVKGSIDAHKINGTALLPMGEGNFIMPVNGDMRKAIKKQKGAEVDVRMELDSAAIKISEEFIACLNDEPKALLEFEKMPASHQHYYSKWIESAKTETTKTKRIALAVNTLAKKMNYAEMIRSQKKDQ